MRSKQIEVIENGEEIDIRTNAKKSAETYLNINESSIKYMLINAVKEQQDKIESLEQELADMKEMMSAVLNGQGTDINRQSIKMRHRR